jgi:copper homeostasis protein
MPPPRVLLEVPISTFADALAAQQGGADRLEVCSALELGGLTPSAALIVSVQVIKVPFVVLARPRPGGCCYDGLDYALMQRDIQLALEAGADGVAFGVLTEAGEIDVTRCRQLVERIKPRQAVFHRAFDVTPRPEVALEQLIDMGVTRVLTSGQEASAYNGAERLRALIAQAAGRIEVLPAGGINRFTVHDVVTRTGCTQVHASLREGRDDGSTRARPQVRFGAGGAEGRYDATSADLVRAMRRLLDG